MDDNTVTAQAPQVPTANSDTTETQISQNTDQAPTVQMQSNPSALNNIVQSTPQAPQFKPSRLGAILAAVAGVHATPDHAPTKGDIAGGLARTVGTALSGIPESRRPGFVSGLGEGARAQQTAQQQAAATHFQNLQAAKMAAEIARDDANLHALPEQLQDEHNKSEAETVAKYTDTFGSPTVILKNHSADVNNWMTQQQANGGVGHFLVVNTGDKFIAWDMKAVTSNPDITSLVQQAGKISGNPMMISMTPERWKNLPNEAKGQIVEQMDAVLGTTTPAKDLKGLQSQLATLTQYKATLSGRTDINEEDKKSALGRLDSNISLINKAIDLQKKSETEQKAEDAKATSQAQGKDVETMQKTGINPITKERLSVENAPDEFLIDSRTGKPIPMGMLAAVKPTMQEVNRAQFAQSTIHSLDALMSLKKQGKLPNGPVKGITTEALVKAGMTNENAQEAFNYIQLAQSAATGAHVGGRFQQAILDKMKGLLALNMNDSQFDGAVESLEDIMGNYVKQGGRITVGEFKQMSPEDQARYTEHTNPTTGKSQTTQQQQSPETDPVVQNLIKKHGG